MSALSEPVVHPAADIPCGTVEERLALVERVACSAAFSKSVRLRDFLRYVGQRAAKLDAPEVHEQEIGENVFGRRSDYDRSQDNIVRVNATELRRRIDTYFATEGADDHLVFAIPRGSYMPVFRLHSAIPESPKQESDPVVLVAEAPPSPLRRPFPAQSWLIAGLLVLLIACIFLLWQNARLRKQAFSPEKHPTVDAFWANMIDATRDTDIVLPDDAISIEEEMTGKRIPLRDYTDRYFPNFYDSGKLSPDRTFDVHLLLSHNLVTLGAIYAAFHIHDLQPTSPTMHLAWARFYSADSMKHDNVVIIGGAKANPWAGIYEDQLNFKLDYDNPTHSLVMRNTHPLPGETASFSTQSNALGAGYSVVAYLPNPSNKGNVILLMGSDSDASNAAAEYLTSEDSLRKLLDTFHRKDFPHFELLLQVSRVRGTSLATKLIAYRTYP